MNPFDKFKTLKNQKVKDIGIYSDIKRVVETIDRSDFILASRNNANDMAFCFLLDCLNRRYNITRDMINLYFKDHGLSWEIVSSKLNVTGNPKLDKFISILKWEPERLDYATTGELLILSK